MTPEAADRAFKAAMEKTAILGHLAQTIGMAAGGHVGANVLGLAGHGGNIADVLAHHGLQHGLAGSTMNPAAKASMKYLFGPESLGAYEAAHGIAKSMAHLPTKEQHALLASGVASGNLLPAMKDAPILGSIHRAAQHELAGTAPKFEAKGGKGILGTVQGALGTAHGKMLDRLARTADTPFDSTGRKIVNSAIGASPALVAGAADMAVTGTPFGVIGHGVVNAARERIAKTDYGKKVTTNLLQKGMRGEDVAPGRAMATNLLLSPAVMDAHRLGRSAREAAGQISPQAQQTVHELGHARHEDLGHLADTLRAAAQGKPAPALPAAPAAPAAAAAAPAAQAATKTTVPGVKPSWGVLGGLGLGAGGLAAMNAMQPDDQAQIAKAAEAPQDEERVHSTMDPLAYVGGRNQAMAHGVKARAIMKAYTNPLTSLINLALLSHHKQASVATFQLALEAEAALQEALP